MKLPGLTSVFQSAGGGHWDILFPRGVVPGFVGSALQAELPPTPHIRVIFPGLADNYSHFAPMGH
jgi:hypothetical protein